MANAFTPGPWHTGNDGAGTARDHCIAAGPNIIGRAYGFGYPIGEGWSPDSAANARLMAASPELLATLIEAVSASGFNLSGPTDPRAVEDGEPAWICQARAVIAQATA